MLTGNRILNSHIVRVGSRARYTGSHMNVSNRCAPAQVNRNLSLIQICTGTSLVHNECKYTTMSCTVNCSTTFKLHRWPESSLSQ